MIIEAIKAPALRKPRQAFAPRVVGAIVAVATALGAAPAFSASVSGDTSTGLRTKPGDQGTTELFVYSEETVKGVTTTNARVAGSTFSQNGNGPVTTTPIAGFGVLKDGTCIRVGANPVGVAGCPVAPNVYGPDVAGVRGLAKPGAEPPTVRQSASSVTGAFLGMARYQNSTGRITAVGTGQGIGRAAGAAFDPVPLYSPGLYDYQEVIDASLTLDTPLDVGGLLYFAVDSRMTDPLAFYAAGQPLDATLWYLSISANGILSSLSDLQDPARFSVSFRINDRSLLDPRMSDGMTPYTDGDIAAAVLRSFTLNRNTASLSGYTLFPSLTPSLGTALPGTTVYRVGTNADGTPVQYGDGVNAGVTSFLEIPEPPAWALAVAALLWLVAGGGSCRTATAMTLRRRA